jgi:WD40 repeat protein
MRQIELNAGPITHLAFRPDGKTLGICFHGGFALLPVADMLAGMVNPRFTPSRDRVAEMAWHPAGRCFALAGAEGIVQIFTAEGYKSWELVGLPGQHGPMTAVAFSPDGSHLVMGGGWWDEPGHAVVVTDYYWHRVAELSGHENQIGTVLFTGPNIIATGAADRRVIFHDLTNSGEIADIPVNAQVHALAVTPDGLRLAVAMGRRIEIWPLTKPGWYVDGPRLICRGHQQSVRSVAFTPDGRTLVSVAEDSGVRFWNAFTGAEQLALEPGCGPARAVAISPDGLLVAVGGKEGKLILLDAE